MRAQPCKSRVHSALCLICINALIRLIQDTKIRNNARDRSEKGKTMKRLVQITLFSLTLGILGCAEQGQYPVSGDECHATDPVLGMSVPDCGLETGV